ncbi:MAG TPA: glycosyltransferase family 2 protein [Candidatus Thermoplasmatota archaeon]|nr:glycosyltransferase family 2 protein [Candidatus Thermoplasmatota archaeon]
MKAKGKDSGQRPSDLEAPGLTAHHLKAPNLKVSIVIPTLNEQGGIGPTLDSIDRAAFEAKGWELELLVIDGASKDRTRQEAERRGARVVVEPRRGYGRAYKRGFAEATGDVLVTGDADGTYPFERAHEFVQALVDGRLDFVNCDRYGDLAKGAMSAKHRFGNWVLSSTARVLFGIRLRDSQSGMWVIRRSALPRLDAGRMAEGMAFSQEVKIEAIRRLDGRFKEIPAGLRPRIGTPVLASWRDGLGNLRALFSWRFRRR